MSEEIIYNLEEIIEFSTPLPDGEYVVKLTDVTLVDQTTDKPYLQATFSIQEGELSGDDFSKRYYLNTFKTRNGAVGCFGLSDIRKEAASIGASAKLKQKFTATELRKLYAQIFGRDKLKILKSMQKDTKGKLNEDGTPKFYQRFTIFALANPTPQRLTQDEYANKYATVGAGADPLSELGF